MIANDPMLTERQYQRRTAGILTEFMEVMNDAQARGTDEVVVDGKRLLGLISSMAELIVEMEPQMLWAKFAEELPYN